MARAIPIGWPGLIARCCSIFLGYYHWSLTGRFGIMKAPNISNHVSPTILCALLLIISKADRLPLKTEPVACNKNTILVLKNKLGQKRYIILLSVKKSVKVYPLFACKLLNYWPSFILHALWPFLLGRKLFFFIMSPDPIVLPFHIFLNLT